jgi:hypothetical protein
MLYNYLIKIIKANLMTGLVNISFKTIFMEDLESYILLSLYIFVLTTFSLILQRFNLKLKFW